MDESPPPATNMDEKRFFCAGIPAADRLLEFRPLTCNPANPWRPSDWRWRLAVHVAEGRCRPEHPWADDRVRQAARLVKALARRPDPDYGRLISRFGGMAEAHHFHVNAFPLQRAELEARLLAGQADADVALRCGLTPGAVAAYHDLFFAVRPVLRAELHVLGDVYPDGDFGHNLTAQDWGPILRLFGYLRGARAVDDVLRLFRDPPFVPARLDALDDASLADLAHRLRVQSAVLTVTLGGEPVIPGALRALTYLLERLQPDQPVTIKQAKNGRAKWLPAAADAVKFLAKSPAAAPKQPSTNTEAA